MNPRKDSRKPIAHYVTLCVLLLWALVVQITSSPLPTYLQARSGEHLPLPFATAEYTTRIVAVSSGYESSGLQSGDNVLALNGQAVEGTKALHDISLALHPGDRVTVTVRRISGGEAETRDIPIVMGRYPAQPPGRVFAMSISAAVCLAIVLTGFYIAFYHIRDPLAWIAMAMLAFFGEFAGSGGGWALPWAWNEIVLLYRAILADCWPFWMLLFALYFPVPFDFVRKRPWLNCLVAAPWILLSAMKLYGGFQREIHIRELGWFAALWAVARYANILAFGIYVCAFFLLLGAKKHALRVADLRRRLNVTIVGCLLAFGPFTVIVMSDLNVLPRLPVGVAAICFLMTLWFPISIAHGFHQRARILEKSDVKDGSTAACYTRSFVK